MLLSAPILVSREARVAADHSAQVSPPILIGLGERLRQRAKPHQLVVRRQKRTLQRSLFCTNDVFPSAQREEAMIAACDELRAILEADTIRELLRGPMSEHLRAYVATVKASALGAVDDVADAQIAQRLRRTVAHQDRRFTPRAITASMLATPIRVHAELEADVGAVVGGEDRTRVVLEDFEARFGRFVREVFDLRREPRIRRIRDRTQRHASNID